MESGQYKRQDLQKASQIPPVKPGGRQFILFSEFIGGYTKRQRTVKPFAQIV